MPVTPLLRRSWLLGLLLQVGCYTVQTAQHEDLGPLRHTHDDHVPLVGPRSGTRVDPTSPLRFHFKDGGQSPWLLPSALNVNESGAFTTQHLSVDDLARIEVRDLSDERRALLHELAEALFVRDDSTVLHVAGPGVALRAWAEAVRQAALPASPEEEWVFFWRMQGTPLEREFRASGLVFQRGVALPDRFVDGVRWEDVSSIEVEHPDYATTLIAVALVPVALAAGSSSFGFFFVGHPTASVAQEPPPADAPPSDAALWKPGRTLPAADEAVPLFSPLAQRRAFIRPLAAVELGTSLLSGQASQLGVHGGVRLRDWFEVGLGVNAWWPNLASPSPFLSGAPLAPPVSKLQPTMFVTARMGVNFDLDADRRVMVPIHLDLGLDFRGHGQVRLAWGIQVRVVGQWFVALRPFSFQYTSLSAGVANVQLPSTLEVGSAF